MATALTSPLGETLKSLTAGSRSGRPSPPSSPMRYTEPGCQSKVLALETLHDPDKR